MKDNNNRRALGKGLEQLFNSEQLDFNSFEQEIVAGTKDKDIKDIDLSEIRSNPYQPRTYFNEEKLAELAESIKEHGILEPVILKKSLRGYDLIAGERRCKAAKLAGLTTVPAIIKDFTDREMMELALIENIQREDLNPIEEAKAYKNIMEKLEMTQDECAKRFGKSRSYITNLLGLLNLPEEAQKMVEVGSVSSSHARILSKLDDESEVLVLASKVKDEGLSVRQLEEISRDGNLSKKKQIIRASEPTHLKYKIYESALKELIGSKINVGNGKIVIPFDSEADLDRIMEILKVEIGD